MVRFTKWTLVLFLIWIAFTNSFEAQSLIVGGLLSMFISAVNLLIFNRKISDETQPSGMINPIKIIRYVLVFIKNLIISNIDVAMIVLNPKLPINPGIVKIETKADTEFKKLIIANSITLTPGTITLDSIGSDMYVHWIDVETDKIEKAGEIIKGDFEKYV